MTPRSFASPKAFRAWLARHHGTASELLVRCYKTHASAGGLTYAEAVDEALCFGWIDGVRRSVDAESFSVRFSPRKPKSFWSAVNIRKATALEAAGRMRAAGRAAFAAREARAAKGYSYESKPRALHPSFPRRAEAQSRGLEVLSVPGAVVPADEHLLGDGGQARGDPRAAVRDLAGVLGEGGTDPAAPAGRREGLSLSLGFSGARSPHRPPVSRSCRWDRSSDRPDRRE